MWVWFCPSYSFLLKGSCSSKQLNPVFLKETWLGLPFCFFPKENLLFPKAFSLKKLFKGSFFSSISFMEGEKNLKKIKPKTPRLKEENLTIRSIFFLENIV